HLQKSRKEEAAEKISGIRETSTVPLAVRPRSQLLISKADAAAEFVFEDLQRFIDERTRPGLLDIEADASNEANADAAGSLSAGLKSLRASGRSFDELDDPENDTDATIYEPLLKLVRPLAAGGMPVPQFRREPDMYPCIGALFRYVDDAIDRSLAAGNARRRLKVCSRTDTNPGGADDYTRIDIGLTFRQKTPDDDADADAELDTPHYGDMLAVIEAKRMVSEQTRAYEQMYMYTRNMYSEQLDRRFAWGLTFCGSVVRACILGHDNVFASQAMDVSTTEGLKAFVLLAVDMSFCESDQLGYDPNISYNAENSRWEMEMYDDKSERQLKYHLRYVAQSADRVFGRHTRCFICREIEPSSECESDGNPSPHPNASDICEQQQYNERDFLVKDAWPHAETRDENDQRRERDEIGMLRTINETLGDDPDLEGKYPQLISAGVVRQLCGDDRQPMRDTTEHIYAMLDQEVTRDVPRRIHKRIAMRPLGLPIRNVRSVDELIVVAADIMKAHLAILRRCDILHRDL
ncbi:hypothetical protein LPJ56_005551, partial [Coemansia sp. RSA 2599]